MINRVRSSVSICDLNMHWNVYIRLVLKLVASSTQHFGSNSYYEHTHRTLSSSKSHRRQVDQTHEYNKFTEMAGVQTRGWGFYFISIYLFRTLRMLFEKLL